MAINRDDQNTFIMIFAILVICIIALVAIVNTFWQIIRSPVEQIASEIAMFFPRAINYDFEIPTLENQITPTPAPTATPTLTPTVSPTITPVEVIDYDFNVVIIPELNSPIYSELGNSTILTLANQIHSLGLEEIEPAIAQIPKLNQEIYISKSGSPQDSLTAGIFGMQNSNGKFLLCYRLALVNAEEKLCQYIDRLDINDRILITAGNITLTYRIIGRSVYNANLENIIENPSIEFIKIITSDLIDPGKIFVILAQRI